MSPLLLTPPASGPARTKVGIKFMSEVSRRLEEAVSVVLANMPEEGEPSRRAKRDIDVAFMEIMRLIAPRVRFFTRQYGLTAHADDAEQCCAIAVHRAIQAYDPDKATFTTFVNWQIKGELQSLRFRLMADQRPSAKKVSATTISLHTPVSDEDSEAATLETLIRDEEAEDYAEAGASDFLADRAREAALDDYVEHLRKVQLETLRRRDRNRRRQRGETLSAEEMVARLDDPYRGLPEDELETLRRELEVHRQVVECRLFEGDTLSRVCEKTGESKDRVRRISSEASRYLESKAGEDGVLGRELPKRPERAHFDGLMSGDKRMVAMPKPGLAHSAVESEARLQRG